jgi:hypothetical protein
MLSGHVKKVLSDISLHVRHVTVSVLITKIYVFIRKILGVLKGIVRLLLKLFGIYLMLAQLPIGNCANNGRPAVEQINCNLINVILQSINPRRQSTPYVSMHSRCLQVKVSFGG